MSYRKWRYRNTYYYYYYYYISEQFLQNVLRGEKLADVTLLIFRDPKRFTAGNVHSKIDQWQFISAHSPYQETEIVLDWIQNNVNVHDFFRPFKGDFKGESFSSDVPPAKLFTNSPSCKPFSTFISNTIRERLASGAISVWGKVGKDPPPKLVMPLTVEPTKPRLCNDSRFLNLWIKDTPFRLDTIVSLPRYVSQDSFQSVCDDKSGYDHIFLSEDSRTYFGFQWAGWYFVSNTIPFGWKTSAYIYHSTGLIVSHFFRSNLIPCSLYTDDRHTGELILPSLLPTAYQELASAFERHMAAASAAIFFVCYTLVSLQYFIGLDKSVLFSRQVVPYLGFDVDSREQAFRILPT